VEKWFKIAGNLLMFTVIAAVLYGGYYFIEPKFKQARDLEAQRDEFIRKIAYKQREIDSLKQKQQRFASDPHYVERVLREHKRVKPNEILFVTDK